MAKQADKDWRRQVIDMIVPTMEANTGPATGFTQATAADFAPITYYGDRAPNDPTALLDSLPLVKMTALKQRALDLHAQIPSFEAIREVQLEKISHANRISELVKPRGDGGPGLSEDMPLVQSERRKMRRAEQEFDRLQTLRKIRTSRWNAAGQLERSVSDWLMRGGVPANCVLEPVEDQPLSELLVKADAGRIDAAVERYRHRRREQLADLHRVRSSPWPSGPLKAAAKAQIERLANAAAPDVDRCVEHNLPVGFMTTRTTAIVHNVDACGAVAFGELPDTLGLMCWLWRDQMLAKINAAIDEAADDKSALDEKARAEMEATIMADALMTERSEVACIWAAETRNNEILDFRPDTTPMASLGVALRTVPRAAPPDTSQQHAYDIVQPGGGQ